MFTSKMLGALFVVAAGGFLNAGAQQSTSDPAQAGLSSALPSHETQALEAGAMQRSAVTALASEVRRNLQDPSATVSLAPLSLEQMGGGTIEATGRGFVVYDGVGALPISTTVLYDVASQRVEHVSYRVEGALQPSPADLLGTRLRDAVADRIGARLVLEFAQQPVDFSLLDIEQMATGRNRVVLAGNGITRFDGEGAAFTRFVATADKSTGKIITVQYELLQEMNEGELHPVASAD